MTRFRITSTICKYLPPLIAGYCRELLYPHKRAIKDNFTYSRKSITGSVFSGNTHDFFSYWFGIHGFFDWRNLLIAKIVLSKHKNSDIIEIGANIGTDTIGFADIAGKNGTVHAFEPLIQNIEELEKIKENNKDLNIKYYPVALSNCQTTMDFLVPPEIYTGIGRLITDKNDNLENTIKVGVHRLDEYIAEFNSVSCIFIDVEGHESFVLEGAVQTIEKFNPVIVVEVSAPLLAEQAKSSMDIYSILNNYNYTCYYEGRFFMKKVKEQNIQLLNRHSNWVCIPATSSELIHPIKKILYKHIFLPLNKI